MSETRDPAVVTVAETDSVRHAARRMREAGVGSLVVLDADGRASGLVTDRDLALRAVAWNKDPDGTPVSEVMSRPLVAVDASEPERALAAMRSRGIRRVPVLRDGVPVALLSFDDLLRDRAETLVELSDAFRSKSGPPQLRRPIERALRNVESSVRRAGLRARAKGWQALGAMFDEIDHLRQRARDEGGERSRDEPRL